MYKAEIHDEIMGARVLITSAENAVLFQDVIVCIDKVDIAKAKIFAHVVKGDDV